MSSHLAALRAATPADLDELVGVQHEGAVAGLGHIFPQSSHPFPFAAVHRRWREELDDPAIHVYVGTDATGAIIGFAATKGCWLLHFGTALRTWGTGYASSLHDAVLVALRRTAPAGTTGFRLHVFEANLRARRFYARLGWLATGERSHSSFAPHPVLLEYRRLTGA